MVWSYSAEQRTWRPGTCFVLFPPVAVRRWAEPRCRTERPARLSSSECDSRRRGFSLYVW